MSQEAELLQEISRKLDLLVAVQRLTNQETLERVRRQYEKDEVTQAILRETQESTTYTDLTEAVARQTGASERTVRRRISDLSSEGLISAIRRGQQVYYQNTGLF